MGPLIYAKSCRTDLKDRGIVLETGGAYIFFDREVSSPEAPLSTPLHVQLLRALHYHQPVDSLCVVPAIFSEMVKDIDDAELSLLKSMRSLGVGGAPTSEAIFQWAAEQGIPYFDCSGATEAAGTICIRRAAVQSMRTCGLQVAPGLEGFLEKESLNDDHGELIIRGAVSAELSPHLNNIVDTFVLLSSFLPGMTTEKAIPIPPMHRPG